MKIVVFLVLLSVSKGSSTEIKGEAGQSVTLPCKYDSKINGQRPACWGRGDLPLSGCSSQLVSTDGEKVTEAASARYQLLGRLEYGNVSLTIFNLTESDNGRYGCRVLIYGWFNDDKHHFDLTVVKETWTLRETTAGPTSRHTTGQLTSTELAFTSSSTLMKVEEQKHFKDIHSSSFSMCRLQENSRLTLVLVLVLFGLIALITAGGILFIKRQWRQLNKNPQQHVFSTAVYNLQLQRRETVMDNIYRIDRGDKGEYEYCLYDSHQQSYKFHWH